MVPGPKMFWQFGERGYDISIGFGGSNVANKPPHWEYMSDVNRLKLWDTYSKLIKLRLANPAVFNNTTFSYDFNDNNGLFRRFQIADPVATGVKITVVANMDVTAQTRTVTFQSTGDWYSYVSNGTGTGINGGASSTFNLSSASQSITLQPGEYHVYINTPPCVTALPTATTKVTYCQNATSSPLTATGTNLLWYTTATGGTGSTTAPTPSTTTVGSTTYYVSQTINGCESSRASITVDVRAIPAAPVVTATAVSYCQNEIAAPLSATGTNLLWYNIATGGTGSSIAFIPSTIIPGVSSYYVSQSNTCGESPGTLITVTVMPILAPPAGLTATAVTLTTATLNWNVTPGIFYSVDYKPATATSWINMITNSTGSSFTIQNLTKSTTYDWRVSANCAASPSTNFTNARFTTASRNTAITNIENGFGLKISPDPAIGEAVVDYLVPDNGKVNLTLFNSLGQPIQKLFSATQNQGQYQLILINQLKGIISGNYFIQLEQNGKVNNIKFIKK
jgi:hypothetical protein